MKGKIFRIAHLGYMNEYDLLSGLAALERVAAHLGFKLPVGAGVKQFQETFIKEKGSRL
jgi:aspartate aminotransferase-like enzyme